MDENKLKEILNKQMLELINAMDDEHRGKLKTAVAAVLDGFRRELEG